MRRASLLTAAAGLVGSLLVSIAAYLRFDTLILFLFVPFVPFLFGRGHDRPPRRACPECGFRTRSPDFAYCPKDGTELQRESNGEQDPG